MELDPDFDADFDELAALAYRTAYRILGSTRDAEDVTQEAMTRALLRWRQVANHARPWVCRVAANLSIDRVRRNGRHRAWLVHRERSPEPAPHDQASLDRIDVQRALMGLPRRQREVLVLRYIADFSVVDAARELGMTESTVKAHAKRALATMRSGLSEHDPAEQHAVQHDPTPETDDARTP